MTGSLAAGARRGDPHVRAVLRLDDGSTVGYRDVRRFGTWLLLEPGELEPYLGARLGEEPLVAAFTAKGLGERLEGRARAAEGRAARPADARRAREHLRRRGALVREAPPTASCGIARRATSSAGFTVRSGRRWSSGSPARARRSPTTGSRTAARAAMQKEFRAYGRDDEPCDRCGTPLEKTRVGGRGHLVLPELSDALTEACALMKAAAARFVPKQREARTCRASR